MIRNAPKGDVSNRTVVYNRAIPLMSQSDRIGMTGRACLHRRTGPVVMSFACEDAAKRPDAVHTILYSAK